MASPLTPHLELPPSYGAVRRIEQHILLCRKKIILGDSNGLPTLLISVGLRADAICEVTRILGRREKALGMYDMRIIEIGLRCTFQELTVW